VHRTGPFHKRSLWNDSDSVFPAGTVPAYARPRAHRRVKGPPVSIVSTDTHQEVVDVTNPAKRPSVLMVVANPGVSTTLGWPVAMEWMMSGMN